MNQIIKLQTHEVRTDSGTTYAMQDCASTAVLSYAWKPESHELAVQFKSDDRILYVYSGVPDARATELEAAPSKGKFIMSMIKPVYAVRKELIKDGAQ